ncbi:prealbumin-like fold domain-containing protein [Methanolapillus millepedarum]|uniref:GLUG domain-containing protein n=1 Tax=Methanolapillus millepedarum TaxID=3028296 RepID=A0AA96V3F4_9EURY|nr:hypothetical protein MsAc7_14340 [Methanosarcinaceae archaeon Ac7]
MKLKMLLLSAAMFVVLLLLCGAAAATPESITDVQQLKNINSTSNLSKDYILAQDLIINDSNWEPIGSNTDPFTGTFNGNGHSITFSENVTTLDGLDRGFGLFGVVNSTGEGSGCISNLTITVSKNLTNIKDDSGILVGSVIDGSNRVVISNCSVNIAAPGILLTGSRNIGGLVGYMSNGTIDNCSSNINIKTTECHAGGIVGMLTEGNISKCYSTGNVTATTNTSGGLVGYFSNGNISECYSTGDIIADSSAGGLAGRLKNVNVSKSYATGNVTGASGLGGLIGVSDNGTVSKSYATGDVKSIMGAGGFIGRLLNGTISECYAAGNVTGENISGFEDFAGGFVGDADNGSISKSYSIGNVNGVNNVGGFAGSLYDSNVVECYATGNATGTGREFVGGFAGSLDTSDISDCYAAGNVNGTGDYVGGFTGVLVEGNITGCYAVGDVITIGNYVGGLVGTSNGNPMGTAQLSNCYALNEIVSGNTEVGRVYGNYHFSGTTPITITDTYAWENMSGNFGNNPDYNGDDISSTEVWQTYPTGTVWSNLDSTVWKQNSFGDSKSYNYRLPILSWQTEILEEDASHLRPKVSPGGGTGGATVGPQNNTAEVKGYESSSSGAILILETVDSSNASKKLTATYELKDANGNSFNPKMIYITNQSGHTEKIYLTGGATYILYETQSSEGYQPLNGSIKIVVNDDLTVQPVLGYNLTQNGGIYTLTIPNSPETAPDNDNKSWFGTWWWLILLILILIIAVAGYWYYKNSSSKSKK